MTVKEWPNCKCTFAQYMVGDGCNECNPKDQFENYLNTLAKAKHVVADQTLIPDAEEKI